MSDDVTKFGEVEASDFHAPQFDLNASVDVGSVTPAKVGLLVRDSSNILYISTGTSAPSDWTKVGAQV